MKSVTKEKTASSSDFSETPKDKPKVTSGSHKASKKPDDVDKWIAQLEDNVEEQDGETESERKQTSEVKEQKDINEQNEATNENFYDEEYDQFHDETQDIYPDQNDVPSIEIQENYQKEKDKKKLEKKQDNFDYGRFVR